MGKLQYPNGHLKEIRDNAQPADKSLKEKLKEQIKSQANLPKLDNPFKTASKTLIKEYIKKQM